MLCPCLIRNFNKEKINLNIGVFIKVQIHNLRGLNAIQQEKIISAMNKGSPLISLPIWENKILKLKMSETRGMSNRQIIELVRSGDDGSGSTADGDIDVDIDSFFSNSNTIGSTMVGGFTTKINRRYLNMFTEAEVFGHIIHEALHRYGFWHRGRHSSSVPYKIGYASRYTFMEFYAGKSLLKAESEIGSHLASIAPFAKLTQFQFSIAS